MGLFGRRKKEDDFEDELGGRRVSKKRFKDLNPQNRKKRKEPHKSWTKKERLLVFYIFASTILLSGILAASSRSWKLPGMPRVNLNLPSFSRDWSLLGSETIVITKQVEEVGQVEQEKAREVVRAFNEKTRDLSGVYGLLVIDLETGFSYGVNEDEIFQAASLVKLPVMVAVYVEVEKGNLDLDTEYVLKNSDKVGGSGSLSSETEGAVFTYRELVSLMGKQSDNTAFGVIKKVLGEQTIEEVINLIGMENISLETNETTLSDIGLFFEGLHKGDFGLEKESGDAILGSLTDTIYEAWITEGIPNDVRVAHKFGREIHVVNDAGIVFAKHPFVLVIMSKGVVEGEADEVIPGIARVVYEGHLGI